MFFLRKKLQNKTCMNKWTPMDLCSLWQEGVVNIDYQRDDVYNK